MTSRSLTFLAAFGIALGVSACNAPPSFGPGSEDFGDAVKQNVAAQTVNPEPSTEPLDEFDGTRTSIAIGRYQANKVKRPVQRRTSGLGN